MEYLNLKFTRFKNVTHVLIQLTRGKVKGKKWVFLIFIIGINVIFYKTTIFNFSISINHELYKLLAIIWRLDKLKY
jgi:hypothetical protein